MTARKRLYLIDGTALAYRSHFALSASPRGGLSTKDGRPTSAIYGFTTTLRALLDREHPDLCVVAFDGPRADLERTKVYPEYKSTRAKAPPEMLDQLDDIRRVVEAHGIPIADSEGHEADDVIGTLAVQGKELGFDVFIVTGDKDFMQLVDDRIRLWNLRSSTRDPEILGVAEVKAKFGVAPEQMVDLLALMGDSSDNIPGVPRIGPKTAGDLLAQFQSLDAALAHTDEIKSASVRKALEEHRDAALLSRDLVTIRTDVPVDLELDGLPGPRPDHARLRELFLALEFDSLARNLPRDAVAVAAAQDYRVVGDAEGLAELCRSLRDAGAFALAIEASGADPLRADPVGIAFATAAGRAAYVPLSEFPRSDGRSTAFDALRPVLEDAAVAKTAHDTKFVRHLLERAGVAPEGFVFDSLLAAYCLEAGIASHDLADLALRRFAHKMVAQKDLLGTGRKQKTFADLDLDVVARHASERADFAWRLRDLLAPELAREGVEPLFSELELPLVPVLAAMEREGIRVDVPHLERLSVELGRRIHELEERVFERAGEPFNLNSPVQIGEVLFGKLEVHRAANISRPKKTRTGQFKTDAAILETLAQHHEVPRLILDHRQLARLKSGYVDSLPGMIDPRTGRIHTSFNQAVAATGRLSSDNPNLQNIPIRTEEGREVRRAFVARDDGWSLLSADYSQIELRILAHVSQDKALIEAFRSGADIHARTAALVHGVLPGMVTPELRTQAKVVNYGLVYGMGPSRLASETGMTPVEARKFIDAYFRALPGVKRYLDTTLAQARETGRVTTMFGRMRRLPDIGSDTVPLRVAAENMAVNTPIQGAAADIIKRAMLAVHAEIERRGLRTRMLLQVHDELVFDVPDDEAEVAEQIVRSAMAGAAELAVPLDVSLGRGRTWLDAH